MLADNILSLPILHLDAIYRTTSSDISIFACYPTLSEDHPSEMLVIAEMLYLHSPRWVKLQRGPEKGRKGRLETGGWRGPLLHVRDKKHIRERLEEFNKSSSLSHQITSFSLILSLSLLFILSLVCFSCLAS